MKKCWNTASRKIMKTKIMCKLMRPSTESYLKVEIPEEIAPHQGDWASWTIREFSAMFIPMDFYLSDANGNYLSDASGDWELN